MNLGNCCNCGTGENVNNLVMLSRRSPEPGIGCWGCIECGLELAGAVAVLCDKCIKTPPPKNACLGSPSANRRIPLEQLTERFDHDMSKHVSEGVEEFFPDEGLLDAVVDMIIEQRKERHAKN